MVIGLLPRGIGVWVSAVSLIFAGAACSASGSGGERYSAKAGGAGGELASAGAAGDMNPSAGGGGNAGGSGGQGGGGVGGAGAGGAEEEPTTVEITENDCGGGLICAGMGCCSTAHVPGGKVYRGTSLDYPATVSSFELDVFEVTVGRFRRFVEAYSGPGMIEPGQGAHPKVPGSGWQAWWEEYSANNRETLSNNLRCNPTHTWTESPGENENAPVNCVLWYEAFAYCIWEGKRLPTDAEWEYAAAGGSQERAFPWGEAEPSPSLANFEAGGKSPLIAVGSTPAGNGRYGHRDLAGSVWEWVFDWYSDYPMPCDDCAQVEPPSSRLSRGGSFNDVAGVLRVASRYGSVPAHRYQSSGFRCAKSSP